MIDIKAKIHTKIHVRQLQSRVVDSDTTQVDYMATFSGSELSAPPQFQWSSSVFCLFTVRLSDVVLSQINVLVL